MIKHQIDAPMAPARPTPMDHPAAVIGSTIEPRPRPSRRLGLLDLLLSSLAILGGLLLAALLWMVSGGFTLAAIEGSGVGIVRGTDVLTALRAAHPWLPWALPAAMTAGELVLWPRSRLARAMTRRFGLGLPLIAGILWGLLWLLDVRINYQGIEQAILGSSIDLFWWRAVVTPQLLAPERSPLPGVIVLAAILLAIGPEQIIRWAWAAGWVLIDDLRAALSH